jgi:BASS family bile acid:Na+ symporter
MDVKQIVVLALQISIVAMVFGFGLEASRGDLLYLVRRPGLLARSLVAMLVVMPVAAITLVRTFDFARPVEIALVALAISPVPPLLPNRERAAGAVVSYGLGLLVTLGSLSIVTVPMWLALLGRVFGVPLGVSAAAIARLMLMMLVGPMIVGVAVRALVPAVADRVARHVGRLALVLLLLGGVVLLGATAPQIWKLIGNGTVLALAIFVVIGLVVGHVFGGPDPDRASVLALSTACRHPVVAMTIAATNFPGERVGGLIVLYLLVNIVVSIPYIVWQQKRAS